MTTTAEPNVLREEAKSELLKEMKELLSMRARVRKEVLEEVKEAMEGKLAILEKREMAWKEEKREALAELDLWKERMREEAIKQMEAMEVYLVTKSEEVKEVVREEMREEHASKATLKKAVETMPLTVAQVVSQLPTLLLSVFKNKWDDYSGEWSHWNNEGEVESALSFDSTLKNHVRGAMAGEMDLKTGLFTCHMSGHFTVTFSAYAQNYSGQGVWLQLSHSGKDVPESKWRCKVSEKALGGEGVVCQDRRCSLGTEPDGTGHCKEINNCFIEGWFYSQGCRSVVIHMKKGDTLQLMARKDGKEMHMGTLWQITFNVNLACLDSHALMALNFNLDED